MMSLKDKSLFANLSFAFKGYTDFKSIFTFFTELLFKRVQTEVRVQS
jgi:hypothetical protein